MRKKLQKTNKIYNSSETKKNQKLEPNLKDEKRQDILKKNLIRSDFSK